MTSATQPFAEASDAKYVQFTTFKRDGSPVSLPIWAARDGNTLYIWTETNSWKVKRLRRNPRVLLQACDARGKKVYGAEVEGVGEVLDADGTDRARAAISKKYGILGWLLVKASLIRRGRDGTIGIAITPAA